jgi:hypothetical protein
MENSSETVIDMSKTNKTYGKRRTAKKSTKEIIKSIEETIENNNKPSQVEESKPIKIDNNGNNDPNECVLCHSKDNVDSKFKICLECLNKGGCKCIRCKTRAYCNEYSLCDKCSEHIETCINCGDKFGQRNNEKLCKNCLSRGKTYICKCCKEKYKGYNKFKCCENCYKLHVFTCKGCGQETFKINPKLNRVLCDKCFYSGEYNLCVLCKSELVKSVRGICDNCKKSRGRYSRDSCRVCGKTPVIQAGCCEECSKSHTFICNKCDKVCFKKNPKETRFTCDQCFGKDKPSK